MTNADILRRAAAELRLLREDEHEGNANAEGRCDADIEDYLADLDAVVAGLDRMREEMA